MTGIVGLVAGAGITLPVWDKGLDHLDPKSKAGTPGFLVCNNRQTSEQTTRFGAYAGPARPAAPQVSPQVLAQQASADLHLGVPHPATSPGLDHFQLVGIPTWLWLRDWAPVSNTAAVPGLSATVSARPVRTTWDFGAAGTVVCSGPGVPWTQGATSTNCSKTFTQSGTFTSRVTVDWAVDWTADTGQGGTLPGLARSTTFDLVVRSAQAVVD